MRRSAAYVIAAFLVVPSAVWSSGPNAANETACLAGMKDLLVGGHLNGPLVCSADAKLMLVGKTTSSAPYSVYDYRYRYTPHDGNVMHGGQRVLVFRRDKYVGQYSMSPPPYTTVTVSGSGVVLSKEGADTVTVNFSKGPPPSIYFDGDTEELFR